MFALMMYLCYLLFPVVAYITYFNYLCTIYKRFQEKNFISFREVVRERFSTFRFRQHFKRFLTTHLQRLFQTRKN